MGFKPANGECSTRKDLTWFGSDKNSRAARKLFGSVDTKGKNGHIAAHHIGIIAHSHT
jgi:hypothetical protein